MAFFLTKYALISLSVAIIDLFFAILVISRRPKHRLNQIFMVFVFLGGVLWPISEFFMRATTDYLFAIFWVGLAWAGVFISPPLILHIGILLTKDQVEGEDRLKLVGAYTVAIVMILLTFFSDILISGVTRAYWGFTGTFGPVFPHLFAFLVLIYFLGMNEFYQRLRVSPNQFERKQLKYVLVGVSIPIILGVFMQVIMPILGFNQIPYASVAIICMDGLLAYSIIQHKLLVINPTYEKKSPEKSKYVLDHKTYIIAKEDERSAWDMYLDAIHHGRQGLCISFKDPDLIRSRYGISKTPIIWLTDETSEHRSISPGNLDKIGSTVREFIEISDKDSIILFDCLDELIAQGGFEKVYSIIKNLNAVLEKEETSLIVSINDARDLELITLQMKKSDIEKSIEFAKIRYHKREMDEQGLRELVKEYEKDLIDLDISMGKIESMLKGTDIEIQSDKNV